LRRSWQSRLADLLAEREAVRKVDFVHTAFALGPSCRSTHVPPAEVSDVPDEDAWFAKYAANLAASR
jgi:hypothetical protein